MCRSIGEIQDQSGCGSCWAVATASVMSDRICTLSNQQNQTIISSADILSCCKNCGNGCVDGYAIRAFEYWINQGVPEGGLYGTKNTCKAYPFAPCAHHLPPMKDLEDCADLNYSTPTCSKHCDNGDEPTLYYGESVYSVKGEENIIRELNTKGPVAATIAVFDDFDHYRSGVYIHQQGKSLGNHVIKIIGYGTSSEGTPYWLVANMWNPSWGENGYIRILRGSDHLGIESMVLAGIPKFN